MKKIELLSPVGDFDCLKAAIQNGADAVYLGASNFNARYSAKNFNTQELEQVINYAHLRNVKVFLTLNTLIKNEELNDAINLATIAYNLGIDAIIVQDIGLANLLLKNFPDLPIHASTQMTCHSLSGAKVLQKAGFKRIVLSRELSLNEIEYIKSNIDCEIEIFAHGALCISYSGQCLYSSLIGGRSGNRGKCAQGCRLCYAFLENDKTIDKGYLLSPKDLCSLELLPELINTGIDSLKIEGRMKSPEYVATVTRIYRKYVDKIYKNEQYIVEEQDKKDLLQVFNRGGFSTGHLSNDPNKKLIFTEKPNNMGIYIGNVSKYNANKGHITLSLNETLGIGDTITFENENTKYTISELMDNNKNLSIANKNMKITIGRMKGNIKPGDKIYKLSSKELSNNVKDILSKENIKRPISAILDIHLDEQITLKIFDDNSHKLIVKSEEKPELSKNSPITKERLEKQLNKLTDTPFYFKDIQINLDDNLFVPHISTINELRRNTVQKYSDLIINQFKRNKETNKIILSSLNDLDTKINKKHKLSLLLNIINLDFDYSKLENVDKLYIPLKYFSLKGYSKIIKTITSKFNSYIYMPTIIKPNFRNLFKDTIDKALEKYNIKGFVISNIGNLDLLDEYSKTYEFIGNYNLNIFNNEATNNLNVSTVTLSPELNKDDINSLAINSKIPTEFIVYGNIPLMTSNYCLLGKANKCYPECGQRCSTESKYYLKDRMNFIFRVIPDNLQTITTIYNSKINSIETTEIDSVDNFRIDILDETIDEINNIISTVKEGKRLEGKDYTNGNLNRDV